MGSQATGSPATGSQAGEISCLAAPAVWGVRLLSKSRTVSSGFSEAAERQSFLWALPVMAPAVAVGSWWPRIVFGARAYSKASLPDLPRAGLASGSAQNQGDAG